MKKINFNNKITGDDEQLIQLLKQEPVAEPPHDFVENTMDRILTLQQRKKIVYKPLKTPLYIMLTIVTLLATPFFSPTLTAPTFLDPVAKLVHIPAYIISGANAWYGVAMLVLCSVSVVIMIYEKNRIKI